MTKKMANRSCSVRGIVALTATCCALLASSIGAALGDVRPNQNLDMRRKEHNASNVTATPPSFTVSNNTSGYFQIRTMWGIFVKEVIDGCANGRDAGVPTASDIVGGKAPAPEKGALPSVDLIDYHLGGPNAGSYIGEWWKWACRAGSANGGEECPPNEIGSDECATPEPTPEQCES